MTNILLNSQNLEYLKKIARSRYPEVGSSHLSEALAAGLGFNKHASLIAMLKKPDERLHVAPFSDSSFADRLSSLSKSAEQTTDTIADYFWIPNQNDLPVPCWQFSQSDATYYKYSKLNLPIIFVKDKKRKYCTIDYDYHFPHKNAARSVQFEKAKNNAIHRLMGDYQRLAKKLEMERSFFDGSIVTGWITKVPISKVEIFAEGFAFAYFQILRDLETEFAI